MFPLRGALVRLQNDGKRIPRVEQGHCVARNDSSTDPGFIFIIPRGRDMLLLGGFAEPDEWSLDIDLENYQSLREVYHRCVRFLPVLKDAEVDWAEPVRVGLRPCRTDGVRLEREPGACIVHNYGHGGSGVTLSWGCAEEAASLAKGLLSSS
jgi:D-amino-acid oxidase